MWTEGAIPYNEITNKEVLIELKKGYRLSKPKNCPDDIYKLMTDCWSSEPSKRLPWKSIYQQLTNLLRDQVSQEFAKNEVYTINDY